MRALVGRLSWWTAASLAIGCAAVVWAQGRDSVAETGGSLTALTSEVRQLRIAVQDLNRTQTQAQALSVYLSAQHSRISQAAARLDQVRTELESASVQARDLSANLASINDALAGAIDPVKRAELEDTKRHLRLEQGSVALREQQARSREFELAQSLQAEEARWTDLTSRLEQLMTKP